MGIGRIVKSNWQPVTMLLVHHVFGQLLCKDIPRSFWWISRIFVSIQAFAIMVRSQQSLHKVLSLISPENFTCKRNLPCKRQRKSIWKVYEKFYPLMQCFHMFYSKSLKPTYTCFSASVVFCDSKWTTHSFQFTYAMRHVSKVAKSVIHLNKKSNPFRTFEWP